MSPRFTLIFGAYDHERYIEQAVRAIRAQTTPFDSIVFFSDGSRDGTLERARSLLAGDPRVTWLDDLAVNRGLVPRMIEAASRIQDGYVMCSSADDVLLPHACETFRALARNRPFEWAMGATEITDEDLRPLETIDPVAHRLDRSPALIFQRLLKLDPWVPAQGWCYSIDLLRRVGGYDPRRIAEDYSLGIRFARAATPAFTGRIIQQWRMHGVSFGHQRSEEMWVDHARVALSQFAVAPRAALLASSSFLGNAALSAARSGRRFRALRHGLAAGLLRPDPRVLVRGAAALYRARPRSS